MRHLFIIILLALFASACGSGKIQATSDGSDGDTQDGDGGVPDGDTPDGDGDTPDGDGDTPDGDGGEPDGDEDIPDGDGGTPDGDGGTPDGDGGTAEGCWSQAPQLGEVVAWLDPDGDDDGPGSETTPFQTLATAAVAVRARLAQGDLPAGGVSVVLKGGTYFRDSTFTLGAQDSGQEGAPVIWRAAPGQSVRISGGAELSSDWFVALASDDPMRQRIPAASHDLVRVIDLSAHGISDYGQLDHRGSGGGSRLTALELSLNGEPQYLSRWPNRGQNDPLDPEADALIKGDIFGSGTVFSYLGTTAADNADDGYANYHGQADGGDWYLYHCTWEWGGATHRYWFVSARDPRTQGDCWPSDQTAWAGSGTDPLPVLTTTWGGAQEAIQPSNRPEDHAQDGFVRIPQASSDTVFSLPGTRYQNWDASGPIWFQGLFYNYWSDNSLPGQVDGSGQVTLAAEPNYGTRARQPFFVFNLPEELDQPGEYWLDHGTGRLYWLPPAGWEQGRLSASVMEDPLLSLESAAHLHFEGIEFEGVRGDGVHTQDIEDVVFSRCSFWGMGDTGLSLHGSDSGLSCCRIGHTGGHGVYLLGGHRTDLTPSGMFVEDTEIHNFGRWDRTYNTAVSLRGVGHRVTNNHLHHAPHTAIIFTGNDHHIAYNDIGHVVLESNDAGAIYTGRDWGYRGTEIEYNFIHDITSVFDGANGVYLDDAASGMNVHHNLFINIHGLATQSGGGRDNLFRHNIMAHIKRGAHSTDRRAQESNYDFNGTYPDSWNLLGRLQQSVESYEYGTPIDHQAEPWASAYPALAVIPDDWPSIQSTHWQDPEGCVFSYNLVWDSEAFMVVGSWGGEGALDSYAEIEGNVEDQDPLFEDETTGNYSLQPGSPAYAIPGFGDIPFDQIGIR